MANYNETSVAGNIWTRCSSVHIVNNYGATPQIIFGEQQLIELNNLPSMVTSGGTSCSASFDASANIAMLDPATGNATGQTVTQQELYNILYSLYIATAKARDASQTPTI
ncbi:hypothetical protein UFOVP306_32 [uncultured Caudovirales phage]|uniref:Uncharacterized protein n=1 Tax=uncultured Caudovirales phage TaxID=2100421 RepID=A0A6J5LXU6_9CAUD|nr:hypothetical protein UFOVP306_32 [uncultured Caudovirales phage]